MFALGVTQGGAVGVGTYLVGQLMVSTAQITAHYVNEYADYEADLLVRNRTLLSGGSGVVVEWGPGGRRIALRAGVVSTVLAVIFSAATAFLSPVAAVLGILALAISWLYSIPPVRLLGTGFGEAATSAVVVGIVPLIGVAVAQGRPTLFLWWAIASLFPIHLAMMLAFEIPDLETDRAASKMVLAVRIGRKATLTLIGALLALSLLVLSMGIRGSHLPREMWWSVAAVAAGGVLTISAATRHRYQISTMSAVATLSAGAIFGLVAAL